MEIVQPASVTISDIHASFVRSDAEREAATKLKQEEAKSMLARLLLDTENLNSIVVIGYTPGFNDGEPCTHGQRDPYLNGRDEYDDDAPDVFTEDGESDEMVEEPVLDAKAKSLVLDILAGMADLLEDAFGTNWAIRVKRTDNGVVFEQEDYDCGY